MKIAGMAGLSLNDFQPQIPTTSFSSDRQISSRLTNQRGSSNPSTSNLSPYSIAVQQGSHYNPSLASHMNGPDMANLFPPPIPFETRPYGNNLNRPSHASTFPFNLPPSFSGGPNSNIHNGNPNQFDHSVHRTDDNSVNEDDKTTQDSYNDNSFAVPAGRRSSMYY